MRLMSSGWAASHVVDKSGKATELGANLAAYFEHRAKVLNEIVRTSLMDISKAKKTFKDLRARLGPHCPLPLNKQKGEKKGKAYFTCIINMLHRGKLPRAVLRLRPEGTNGHHFSGGTPAHAFSSRGWRLSQHH